MAKSISKRNSVKVSKDKPLGKAPYQDKTIGIDQDNFFYEIEGGDNIEESE